MEETVAEQWSFNFFGESGADIFSKEKHRKPASVDAGCLLFV